MRFAALLLACAVALAACDGYDPGPAVDGMAGADMRGAAGAGGTAGGAGGAGGYVPDPAETCPDPTPGVESAQIVCDAGGGNAPTFDASGHQCYSCPGRAIPTPGCAIRLPMAVSGGGTIVRPPRDIFCPAIPCDPTLCHVK